MGPLGSQGTEAPMSPLPPQCCRGSSTLRKFCGFSFPLIAGGKMKTHRNEESYCLSPAPAGHSHHSYCVTVTQRVRALGGSFSLRCDAWQKGMGNRTAFSFAPSVPYLHPWELGFRVKMVETDVFRMGLRGLPVALCGQTDSVGLLQ